MDRNKPQVRSLACDYFDQFVNAGTCKSIMSSFQLMLHALDIKSTDHRHLYRRLRSKLTHWKAQSLFAKLDKRASCKEYKGEPCSNTKVLIIGSGPCGLRAAIEVALLGGRAVVVEKREHFSRNNVLHLWPFLITDLKNLGAKKFFGRFCAGAIDHISIRQLQCILLKVALMFGVEIYVGVTYEDLLEPPEDQETNQQGWRCVVSPKEHAISEYEFDVLVAADGKRNTVQGFKRREFRGKLAIAITANFINSNTTAEAKVEEISGVAFIFNQKFFLDLKAKTAIDLENIVYYKDDTHYFVMTAKKQSLLHKGVLKADYRDTVELLDRANVNHDKLLAYAVEAADVSTNNQLPKMEYAINHYGQPDVAMFDFTSMFAAFNSSRVVERNDHKLLIALVGDSLLEPFWPIGSGCARGFLGVFDTAFMIRRWASGKMTPLQILAERESMYQLLSQTTPENLNKNFAQYTIDPNTRYPNVNMRSVACDQVRQYYDCGDNSIIDEIPTKKAKNDYLDSYSLLRWCQRVLNTGLYRNVHVVDFTMSWKSGLALSALVHAFRPDLIDFHSLMESDVVVNNEQVFDIANRELGIPPVMSGMDMSSTEPPDKLTMIAYLSQFYEVFKMSDLPKIEVPALRDGSHVKPRSPAHKASFLNRLSHRFSKAKRKKDKEDEENDQPNISFGSGSKKSKDIRENGDIRLVKYNHRPVGELSSKLMQDDKPFTKTTNRELQETKVNVSAMAEILVSKFKGNMEQPVPRKVNALPGLHPAAKYDSEFCYFCKKRVYIMERMTAEGIFFHSGCMKCDFCGVSLRLQNYSYRRADTGEEKFYCYRHYWHANRSRKRFYDEEEIKSEKPPPRIQIDESPTIHESNKMTPKKVPAPLDLPEGVFSQPKKTPERVEFENSIDSVHEETEEEQTEYNLRASLSSDTLLDEGDDDSDDESSDDDDIVMLDGEDPKDPLTWVEACKLAETWNLSHSQENLLSAKRREDEESTDEEDEDSEYESDTEEADDSGEDSTSNRPGKSHLRIPTSPVDSPTSPSIQMAARASFFSAPPQVLRLDPFQMFGMGKKGTDPTTVQEINADDDKKECQLRKPSESEDSETVNDKETISFEESDDIIKLDDFPMDSGESTTMSTATSTDNLSEGPESEEGSETEDKEVPNDKFVSEEDSDLENKTIEIQDEDLQVPGEKSASEKGPDTEEIKLETEDNKHVSEDDIVEEQFLETPNERPVSKADSYTKERAVDGDLSPAEDDDLVLEAEQEEDYDQSAMSRAMELLLVEIDTKPSLSDDDLLLSIEGTQDQQDEDENEDEDDDEVFISEKLVEVEGSRAEGKADKDEKNVDEENLETMNTERQVLQSVKLMGDNTSELDGDTLIQIMQSIQAMTDSGDAQELPAKEDEAPDFQHIDESFITQRKMPRRAKKLRRRSSDASNSSFTISTPSDSIRSSISSLTDVVQSNQKYLNSDDAESIDADMLTDYQTTMSQALADEESFDDAEDNQGDDSQNNTLISDEPTTDQQDSSVYLTPNASIEQSTSIKSDALEISNKLFSSFSEDGGVPPKEPDLSPIAGQSGNIIDSSVSDVANSSRIRESEDSDLKLNQLDLSPIAVKPHSIEISKLQDELEAKENNVVMKSEDSAKYMNELDRSALTRSPIRRKLPELTAFKPSPVSEKKVKSLSPVVKLGDVPITSTPKVSDFTSVKSSKFPDEIGITPMEQFKTPLKNSKIKVPVDWSRIVESSGSVSDVVGKKKVAVDSKLKKAVKKSKSSAEDVEDIPFADDTEAGDVFYTPRTSVKSMANKPTRSVNDRDMKKRLLPTPPVVDNDSNLHLRQVKNVEMVKAREVAREKARLKSDEELGIINKSYGMDVARSNSRSKDSDTRSTPRGSSTSDVLSDSDESKRLSSQTSGDVASPQNGATSNTSELRTNKNKKDKSKTSRNDDTPVFSDSDSSRTNSLKKDKKKSILSMFRPKTPEKVGKEKMLTPIKSDSKTTPKNTGENQKRPKSAAKSDKKKDKKKRKSGVKDNSANELSENMKDLRIKSVFYTPDMDLSKYREKSNIKNRIGIAPKAEVDEFSDSGESLMSTDTQVSKRSRSDRQHLTEEEVNERIAKRVQSAARRQQKQKELRRMRRAQEIQRKLEEVEVKQKDLAEEGISVERKLREGTVGESEEDLMKKWFGLVKNKNDLLRYESELMVQRKELELLDRQSRLEQEIRERMSVDDADKSEEYMVDEKRILDELLEVVEERDSLVLMTDEDRLREQEEDRDLQSVMQAKGFVLTPAASRKTAPT